MIKKEVKFTAVKINRKINKDGGYMLHVGKMPIIEDENVYEEVRQAKTLPLSADLLQIAVKAVLQTMIEKTAADGRPRKIGNLVKCYVSLRGKVNSPYSAYNEETCSSVVLLTPMKGLKKKKVDLNRVRFVNAKTGTRVIVDHIAYEGSCEKIDVIKKNTSITVNGMNLQFLDGDTITIAWKDAENAEHTALITPAKSDVTRMTFLWPKELDGADVGTEVKFRFEMRGGIADGDFQSINKKVTIIDEI